MIVGYAYVVADLLHIGHLKYLRACSGLCDKLVVGVLTDGATMEKKSKPIISFGERLEIVKNLKFVDVVVKQETYSPLPNVENLQPDVLFESTSHSRKAFEKAMVLTSKIGCRLTTIPYYAGQSSTSIKNKVLRVWKYKEETHPKVINLEEGQNDKS